METAKKRTRINVRAICSSDNYQASKRAHKRYYEAHIHEWEDIISHMETGDLEQRLNPLEEAKHKLEDLHMRPYCKILGRTKEISSWMLESYIKADVKIYWR